ncbi:MAG: phage tail tape measure protein [Bacteroidaceae bacterium]|nr:phage tail tape measure protein [Bacteroidaceae bacterium]
MDKSVKFRIELETNGEKILGNLSMSVDEFKEAISGAIDESKKLKDSLGELAKTAVLLDSITSLMDQMVGAVGSLADEFNTFDKSMRAVNTMAGKDAAGLEALKGDIEDLAGAIPLAKNELANGLYQVISNGVPEDNWIAFLEQSARSAVGGIADLGQTVTVTSTLIKNYGLEWSAAAELQDKIQMTAKNGVTSFEQLAAALPRVTGNASALGVTVDELMATFATLTGVSGNTAEVSTQLAAIFTALIKPSSEAAEMAEMMGIRFDAAAIKAAGGMQNFLSQLSANIQEYAASHGVLEQEIYGKLFGSAEAMRALIPITGELADTFSANVAAMADSSGTIDAAFESMAGSGESVQQMLKNQMTTMLDWAGSIASSIQPYLSFVAVSGHAVSGTIMMAKTAKQAAASIAALTAAHKSNAVVATISAAHTKVVALAQRILAASSVTATAGTWALNAAVAALYATLTFGISAVISGLVALFSSMGDEAEEASEKVDVLQESTDAFNNSASEAKAAIDMELVSLRTLIQQKKDATEKVEELNRKYGESMGQYKTASEWYDILTRKSKVYCQQIGYEAQAKVLASQIAAKELEKEEKMRQLIWYGQQYWDKNGRIHYNYEKVEGGEETYNALRSEVSQLIKDISTCQNKYDTCIKKMLEAQGELTEGVDATQKAIDWQTLSYSELGKAIEDQKKKLSGLIGKNASEAAKESEVLKRMEARYKKWGEDYGLSTSSSNKNEFDGKKLIANAKSYKELGNNLTYYKNQLEKTAPSETAEIARLTKLINETQQAQDEVKAMMDAVGRPVELKTLADIDKEIQYQQGLRKNATAENIAGIDAEITRLNKLKTALEAHSNVILELDKIETYEQLEQQLSQYNKQLKIAGASERQEIQKKIDALKALKEVWDAELAQPGDLSKIETIEELERAIGYYEQQLKSAGASERLEIQKTIKELKRLRDEWDAAMVRPEGISKLNTIEALEEAISYYNDKQRKASAQELADLQRTTLALETKLNALKRLTNIPSMQQEIAELDALSGKKLKLELELLGLESIKSKIRDLQKMLADTKNPLDSAQRLEVERLVDSYKNYERVLKKSQLRFTDAWGGVKDVSGGIQELSDTLEGNGTAWEKVVGCVDAAIQIAQGINSIIKIIETLTAVTTTTTAVTTASGVAATTAATQKIATAPAEVAAASAVTAATKVEAMAYRELAASAFMAAYAYIPFAGLPIAAGNIATMQGLVGSVAVTPFANGGLLYGPTLALMGEYPGASRNPEVIAPLDKLKTMIGGSNDGIGGSVDFKIRGRHLEGVLVKENKRRKRT